MRNRYYKSGYTTIPVTVSDYQLQILIKMQRYTNNYSDLKWFFEKAGMDKAERIIAEYEAKMKNETNQD